MRPLHASLGPRETGLLSAFLGRRWSRQGPGGASLGLQHVPFGRLIRKARQRSGLGPEGKDPEAHPSSGFPSTEDVIRKTEQITKNIQELLRAAQESKHER